jgi:hypothetical protein
MRKKSVISSQADRRFSLYELPDFSETDSISRIWHGRKDSVPAASVVLSYLTLLSGREDIREQPTIYITKAMSSEVQIYKYHLLLHNAHTT